MLENSAGFWQVAPQAEAAGRGDYRELHFLEFYQ